MSERSDNTSDSVETSELGRKEHWDAIYEQELADLHECGQEGELWFGEDVMETMLRFTADQIRAGLGDVAQTQVRILDIGTGNGVLPLELASLGYSRVTGSDYCQSSIDLARAVAKRRGTTGVQWRVDNVLHPSSTERYDVITDKGTFDAIGLSEGGRAQQALYRETVHSLLQPGGLLIITSCNSTLQELTQAFTLGRTSSGSVVKHDENGGDDACAEALSADDQPSRPRSPSGCPGVTPGTTASSNGDSATGGKWKSKAPEAHSGASLSPNCPRRWVYFDHVRTYKVYSFGGFEGSKVCTVAFKAA